MASLEVDTQPNPGQLVSAGINTSTGAVQLSTTDVAGRGNIASDDVLALILQELRLMNFLIAQAFGFPDDLDGWRNDRDLSPLV